MLSLDSSPSWFLFSLLAQFYYFFFLANSYFVVNLTLIMILAVEAKERHSEIT